MRHDFIDGSDCVLTRCYVEDLIALQFQSFDHNLAHRRIVIYDENFSISVVRVHFVIPSSIRRNAYSFAQLFRDSKRPEAPVWPAPISVYNKSGFLSVFSSRSLATHLAGSQYWTCES